MKKIVLFVLLSFTLLTLCAAGCEKGKNNNTEKTYIEKIAPATRFSMTMVEKKSFYYPTVEGKVNLNFYPEKLEVNVENKGSFIISKTDYTDILCVKDRYVVSFTKIHIFGSLKEGEYRVTIKAFDKDKPYLVDYETFLSVDELYTALSGFDYATGEIFYAMDKESNWIGPYKIVQPIKSNETFYAA